MGANKRFRLNGPQIMVLGFAGLILLGTLLLMLPVSSAAGKVTSFGDALFTSTTSVCVTGLIVQDTGTYWSTFGHTVILILIQIGGLGVVTVAASFAMISGRRIGLFQRSTMQEAVAAHKMGGIVRLTGFLLKLTFIIEAVGAVLLAPAMIRDLGWGRGIWTAIFTSISAFCNAGIDLFGGYSSATAYVGDPLVNLTLMALIVIGGLGFLTWDDIRTNGIHLKRYRMQSKVILTTTIILLVVPALWFFFLEFTDLPLGERIFASLFQSTTTRTAGFNTVDLNTVSEPGKVMMILWMLVGGSPGSTAGGLKTTTLAILVGCTIAVFRKRESPQFFGRRVGQEVVSAALTITFMYVILSVGAAMVISRIENLPMLTSWFETASAVGTVGLSLGITPGLSAVSKGILIILMYFGRVGGLTLIYAALSGTKRQVGKLPLDHITVG
ncbi:MAG: Trk family potassium uptake protein [Oscillospiraceae bacterium]|nr:Trk family potassium uptake protein [Oscillospiraceae bacterium]